jgi:hypothetical protein
MGCRQYPIWIDVEACIYQSKKSYGAKDTNTQRIYVGTSSKNSHLLAEVITTRREEGDNVVFKLSVDRKVIKKITMDKKTKTIIED